MSAPRLLALLIAVSTGCAEPQKAPPAVAIAVAPPLPAPPPDALGPRPEVPPPAAYAPPVPEVFVTKEGVTVWLVERHALPYLAMTFSIPTGSSSDPRGKAGLSFETADMLDEGAGGRGAIELSRAIDALGASIVTAATVDASTVSLSVLKKNIAPAFTLFSDVVARPRFDAAEWTRAHELELNDLTERAADPEEVERLVTRAVLFGPDHPYAHPVDGTTSAAKSITLDDVRKFCRAAWRPDRAFLVVVGDTTRAEVTALVDQNLGSWKISSAAPPPVVAPDAPKGPWPKLVLVDRSDAPQSVISLARPGLEASDPREPVLVRANLALGGLFTSRLNQDLREQRGYTYGAGSRVAHTRGVGSFVASAAVFTEKTADAVKALVDDVAQYAKGGLTNDETDKTRLQMRGDLVEKFEAYDRAAEHLAIQAALALPPDHERTAALAADGATKEALSKIASELMNPASAALIVVGPAAKVEGPLRAIGYGEIELRDTDGNVVKPKKAPGPH
jgi:predicted Zn-dependent peptidase